MVIQCKATVPRNGGANGKLKVMLYFGDVEPFLEEPHDIGPM